jgi:predicted Zn-dependent protease with MMP-like domain
MPRKDRERFDELLEGVLHSLPPRLTDLLEEAPLIVEDRPSRQLLRELGMDEDDDLLCGLHSGTALTERSVEQTPEMPETIHIFREGIIDHAGGWERWKDEEGQWWGGPEAIGREIRITILHEIGHHFGLDEDDLRELGYD